MNNFKNLVDELSIIPEDDDSISDFMRKLKIFVGKKFGMDSVEYQQLEDLHNSFVLEWDISTQKKHINKYLSSITYSDKKESQNNAKIDSIQSTKISFFISWSKDCSHNIAIEMKNWFPLIFNKLKKEHFFVSSIDIDAGTDWFQRIRDELSTNQYAILILTNENLKSEWMHFEAGAIAKAIQTSRIYSILMDITPADLSNSPICKFQCTRFEENDFLKLIKDINKILPDDAQYQVNSLEKRFKQNWDIFQKKILSFLNKDQKNNTSPYITNIGKLDARVKKDTVHFDVYNFTENEFILKDIGIVMENEKEYLYQVISSNGPPRVPAHKIYTNEIVSFEKFKKAFVDGGEFDSTINQPTYLLKEHLEGKIIRIFVTLRTKERIYSEILSPSIDMTEITRCAKKDYEEFLKKHLENNTLINNKNAIEQLNRTGHFGGAKQIPIMSENEFRLKFPFK